MTVGSDLKTAVATLINFEQFALGTQNQQAINLYTNLVQSTQQLVYHAQYKGVYNGKK
ncbi:DUF1657 domain-containing protein [Paenibacillus sp. S3N08]|uniref:DUF1657 domain-containing protein n=1 Tax=Paenibacillus agricola TaxID=2716264 RepID=A0ABX0JI25_9BACL|nr:DUF1657 domain-containing protein [Paenibacillus agricola]